MDIISPSHIFQWHVGFLGEPHINSKEFQLFVICDRQMKWHKSKCYAVKKQSKAK